MRASTISCPMLKKAVIRLFLSSAYDGTSTSPSALPLPRGEASSSVTGHGFGVSGHDFGNAPGVGCEEDAAASSMGAGSARRRERDDDLRGLIDAAGSARRERDDDLRGLWPSRLVLFAAHACRHRDDDVGGHMSFFSIK